MNDLNSLIAYGAEKLDSANIPEPRREAASLLAFAIGKDKTFLIAHPEYEPSETEADRFAEFIARRSRREPYHYITGQKEFFGLDFKVTPAVLIPRPETEMLVEQAIRVLSARQTPSFCEIGVGSGCISIAVLVNSPNATAVGLEMSNAAIAVARENLRIHDVGKRFDIREADLFSALNVTERFDLMVSNPPYISSEEFAGLEAGVRKYEPENALTDGLDGLSIIRRIVREAPAHLKPDGRLILEIGHDQADSAIGLLTNGQWTEVETQEDFQGIRRTVSAVLSS